MHVLDLFDDDEAGEGRNALFEEMKADEGEEFPMFFGSELANALRTARKSLVVLKIAQPDHPLLSRSIVVQRNVEWLWNEEDVEAAWDGPWSGRMAKEDITPKGDQGLRNSKVYPPELVAQFRVFDLEPGASSAVVFDDNGLIPISTSLSNPVYSFISRFPNCLPALTPTLAHLNALTFAPLVSHASELSRALLGLFLPHSHHTSNPHSNLNFSDHLVLLRSYILLTSHAFKSRLAAALFSDSGEYDFQSDEVDIRARARRIKFNNRHIDDGDRQWAVGLAPALTEREVWPPGGADLSFMLRTVIVDSLDEERSDGFHADEGDDETTGACACAGARGAAIEEAEWRLGFAIRDLPVGAGRDRWLNPTCEPLVL